MKFIGNVSGQVFEGLIGFCSPKSCSSQEATDNIDLVFKIYQQGMGLPLDSITKREKTDFYDPKSPVPGNRTTSYIVFGILGLITAITMYGTGLGIYREFKQNQRKKADLSERLLNGDESREHTTDMTNERAQEKPKRELRGIFKLLDCWDARKNFDKIIKVKYTETYDHNLEIFNGIRVLMMLYVVYGHSFIFGTNYIDNLTDMPDLVKDWWLLVIFAALYSVDVFFYMSGFLFAYIGTGKLRKIRPNPLNYIGLCFHRLLRFWPTYVVAILFFWKVLPVLGEGPIWFKMTYYTNLCEDTWWQNVLLADDLLVKNADYCFGWGWYLSNDFQMFLITPIFIWLYIKNRTVGKLAMFGLICLSWILALIIGAELNVRGGPPISGGITNEKGFANYYIRPYIRLPPYFIGILAALMYKEFKDQIGTSWKIGRALKESAIAKNVIAFIGAAIIITLVFCVRPLQLDDKAWPDWAHVTFRAFQKSLYVIALTMLITPILLGDHNLLKRFLAHPIFIPLARLSFSAYLVHLFFVYKNYMDLPFSFHMTYANGTLNTISNAAFSFLGGLILSLTVEIPMANIEAGYLSGGGKKRPAKKVETPQEEREASIIPIDNDGKVSTN